MTGNVTPIRAADPVYGYMDELERRDGARALGVLCAGGFLAGLVVGAVIGGWRR